jgi:cytochrome c biogenesis protein CcdA
MRKSDAFVNKLNLFIGITMVLVYIAAGLLVLFAKFIQLRLQDNYRLILGVAILVYGAYRLYRVYKKYNEQKESQEDEDI